MSNVIPFDRKGKKPHHRKEDVALKETSDAEVYHDIFENIITDWQKAAVANRLSEYIASKVPYFQRGPANTDYANDLNALSTLEQKLDLKVSLFWPGGTSINPYGWLAGFHANGQIFTTPADMSSEANARALNIVLYFTFKLNLQNLGREILIDQGEK